ncbi:MAG: tetratricopeptide repeat protein [Candidatus Melainabacteria bacterium]|nr:MAG: tetratricopeptide repeat protein [Candidatus Melainabacteria bacterium]
MKILKSVLKRKSCLMLVALSLSLMQRVCYAADSQWDAERSAGQKAYNSNNYAEASRVFEAALKRLESSNSDTAETDVATCCMWLANVYLAQAQYTKAEPLYKRALSIAEKIFGAGDPRVATALNNLAWLYACEGRYIDAEPLYARALSISETALGPDNPRFATSLNNLAALYTSEGRYSEAQFLYKRALALREKNLGPEHADVAASLNNLALLYSIQERYPEAEPLYKKALAIQEKALGPDHRHVATSLNNLAGIYASEGRYDEAEPVYRKALSICEKSLGLDHPYVANCLNNLAWLYSSERRYAEAEPLYKRALAVREKTLGIAHPDVATALNNLALLYSNQGRYPEAEPLLKRSLTIREKALRPDHPDVATALNNLADLYASQDQYQEVEPLYERSLAIREHRNGRQKAIDPFLVNAGRERFNILVPLATLNLADEVECLKQLHANPRARVMSKLGTIFATRKKNFGKDDPRTAEVLIQIGILSESLGGNSKKQANSAYDSLTKFAGTLNSSTTPGAQKWQRKRTTAVDIESMKGDKNAESFAANALLCLGDLLAANHEVAKAKECLHLSEKCFLAQSSAAETDLYKRILSLAESWINLGDYSKAQDLAAKASGFARTSIAKYDCAVFDARVKLAEADYTGAFTSAKSSLQSGNEAVASLGSTADKSEAILESYKIIIQSALSMGKLNDAAAYADQALNLRDLSNQGRVFLLIAKGTIKFQDGSFEDARKILQEVAGMNNGTNEIDQAIFTQAACIRGLVLAQMGDLPQAQRTLTWALQWDQNNPSPEGLLATARDYDGLALVEISAKNKDGDPGRAKYYTLAGSERIDKYLKSAFPGLSIGQQCAFLAVAKQQRDAILTTCQTRESIGPAYSTMMRWKGLLLESLRTRGAIKAAIQSNPELKQKQEQLENKILLLSSLANRHADTESGANTAHGTDLSEQYRRETAERERLEREITAASGVILKDPLSDTDVDSFRALLKPDEAFIDILPYRPLNESSEHYAVVAMKNGLGGDAQFFDLGKRDDIDQIIRKWRFGATGAKAELERDIHQDNEITTTKMEPKEFDDLTAKLSELVLSNAKLQEYLGTSVKHLWLSPEGEFSKVPWSAVATLRNSMYQSISQVDSPREFAFLRMQKNDTMAAVREKNHITYPQQKNSSKILLAGLSDFRKAGLNNLDGALKEIESLKKLADALHKDVDYLSEYDATREIVTSKLTKVACAHIATHGFAGNNNAESENTETNRSVRLTTGDGGGIKLATARNPLSDCGIYLAFPKDNKKNARCDLAPNILTADEIIGLDLSRCEILTLSACETGLGRTLSGQGVIGLRSAIIGAGAKAVLMSLWSVPDEATQELMRHFYSNLWEKGMNKQDALANAQSYIRRQPQWADPKNWAAWVLVGE